MDNFTLNNNPTKQKTRRYFTVSLSSHVLATEKPFKCWECGHRITTITNDPVAMVEAKIKPDDACPQKLSEILCRNCNIIYLFV